MNPSPRSKDIHEVLRDRNKGHWLCVVGKRWKHVVLRQYLQGADSIRFTKRLPTRMSSYRKVDYLLVWGRQTLVPHELLTQHPNLQLVSVEDGFISTRGLGLTGSFFYSLLFDKKGIHFDAGHPSDIEDMLLQHEFTDKDEQFGQEIIDLIRCGGLNKCNLSEKGMARPLVPPGVQPVILAIGQLEHDKALRCSLGQVRTNLQLLQEIRRLHPEAWVVFKPHPIQLRTASFGRTLARLYLQHCDQLALRGRINDWIDSVNAVHVISSTTGLEALIRGKPVHTYGTPIYSGWGLTVDRHELPGRGRKLTIQQLVACIYGHYPRYFNWTNGRFESAKDVLDCLHRLETGQQAESFFDPRLGTKQRRTQRWRHSRLELLRPVRIWRIRRARKVNLESIKRNPSRIAFG